MLWRGHDFPHRRDCYFPKISRIPCDMSKIIVSNRKIKCTRIFHNFVFSTRFWIDFSPLKYFISCSIYQVANYLTNHFYLSYDFLSICKCGISHMTRPKLSKSICVKSGVVVLNNKYAYSQRNKKRIWQLKWYACAKVCNNSS